MSINNSQLVCHAPLSDIASRRYIAILMIEPPLGSCINMVSDGEAHCDANDKVKNTSKVDENRPMLQIPLFPLQ